MGVVSADAWHIPEDMQKMVDDEEVLLEDLDEIDSSCQELQAEAEDKTVEDVVRPSEHIVMVWCWLAMKELSLPLGTVIRKVPLPTSDEADTSTNKNAESVMVSDGVLDLRQLETIGNHFLEVLMKMKHNGAIDKTTAGFTTLCNRILCSNDPSCTVATLKENSQIKRSEDELQTMVKRDCGRKVNECDDE